MALSEDLVQLADGMLSERPGRPIQAELRRSVSTAYYAVFHGLIEESTKWLAGAGYRDMRRVMARSFEHGAMRDFAERVIHNSVPDFVRPLIPSVPTDLMVVASVFSNLQGERHRADYDWASPFNKVEVQRLLTDAHRVVIQMLMPGGYSEELKHFLMMLPFWGQLRRRG
jgi:hypothetical protein